MIVKLLDKTSSFNAVTYNTNKIKEAKGELMYHTNFPFLGDIPNPRDIKNYLKSVSSSNSRVKKPQFHATISAKDKEYSKDQLTDIGKEFMKRMGYENQPYIIVFHDDTDNNHIHIVSTRVTVYGGKIDHNYENVRSQRALKDILKEKYGIDEERKLDYLLKYKVSSDIQMKNLLELNGFSLINNEKGNKIYHRGVFVQDIEVKTTKEDRDRIMNLQHMFNAYSTAFDVKIQKNRNNHWTCEMLERLKEDHNIDVIFHQTKNTDRPFGYTVVDNEAMNVFKGSQVFNMRNFIESKENNIESINYNGYEKTEDHIKENNNDLAQNSPSIVGSFIGAALSGNNSGIDNDQSAERNKKRKRKR